MISILVASLTSTYHPPPHTARNPNPETRNMTPETRNPKPETRIPNPESRIPNPESSTLPKGVAITHTLPRVDGGCFRCTLTWGACWRAGTSGPYQVDHSHCRQRLETWWRHVPWWYRALPLVALGTP
ncbi:hypothetical protein T484DRAFT_1625573 [Baffinella frigidus]|nr:hypothetical protein T484DRAFT_1625573 [Cryptophyta sp. CCMP2293]